VLSFCSLHSTLCDSKIIVNLLVQKLLVKLTPCVNIANVFVKRFWLCNFPCKRILVQKLLVKWFMKLTTPQFSCFSITFDKCLFKWVVALLLCPLIVVDRHLPNVRHFSVLIQFFYFLLYFGSVTQLILLCRTIP